MSSADAARRYVELLEASTVERLGAVRFLSSNSELDRLLAEVHKGIERVDSRTWRASSAWHAAAWLGSIATEAAIRPQDPNASDDLRVTSSGPLIFRGQRDARWPILPSIAREEPLPHVRAVFRFMLAMNFMMDWEEMPRLHPSVHVGTAQHYGILKTGFLDFTADPLIALFFSCDGAQNGDEAAAYCLPVFDAMSIGSRFLIAPPWIRRIHRQLGIFVEAGTEDLGPSCYRIVFPADDSYADSAMGPSHEEIYPEDPWFEDACRWALGGPPDELPSFDESAARALTAEPSLPT